MRKTQKCEEKYEPMFDTEEMREKFKLRLKAIPHKASSNKTKNMVK